MLDLLCYGLPWRSVGSGGKRPRRLFGRKADRGRVRPARRRVSPVMGVRRSPVRGGGHHVAIRLARPSRRRRDTCRRARGRAGRRPGRQRGPRLAATCRATARARKLGDHRPEHHCGGHGAAASTGVGAAATPASRLRCLRPGAHLARSACSDAHHPPPRAGAGPAREHRILRRARAALEATSVDRARRGQRGPRRARNLGRIRKRRRPGKGGSPAHREDGAGRRSRYSAAAPGDDPRTGGAPAEDGSHFSSRTGAGHCGHPRPSPAGPGSSRGGAGGSSSRAGSPSGRGADSEACRASQGGGRNDRARRAVLNELYTSRPCGEDLRREANQ
jgi:hypothetical protein